MKSPEYWEQIEKEHYLMFEALYVIERLPQPGESVMNAFAHAHSLAANTLAKIGEVKKSECPA